MKKQCISFMLIVGPLFCAGAAMASCAKTMTAIIDGKTADRVHLREKASAKANSLGFYFTGTQVQCGTNTSNEWTWVTIGTQSGYIKTEYLYFGNNPGSVEPQQPSGTITNIKSNSWVNLRAEPSQNHPPFQRFTSMMLSRFWARR